MSAYDGDSSYDASSRPTSRASSPLPDEPSTLLDTQLLIRYKAWMASNPGEVVTLDPTSSDLIYYILCVHSVVKRYFLIYSSPSVNGKNKRAVEPRNLDTVFKTHGIALPHCFCLVKRNNDVVGTETEFVKRKNVFQFLCRRRTGGCGYSGVFDSL